LASSAEQAHILLVEDNRLDVLLVQEALALHHVPAVLHVIEDGEAAIRFIDASDRDVQAPCPALVLLDLNLPKRTGAEVLRYLRRSRKCSGAKVLIVSSSDAPMERAAVQSLGANGYFRKPSSYDEFLRIGEVVLKLLEESPDA
jgi:chemotaxis family two-component system response regulator Rcp1